MHLSVAQSSGDGVIHFLDGSFQVALERDLAGFVDGTAGELILIFHEENGSG